MKMKQLRPRPSRKFGYLRRSAAAGLAVAIDRHGSFLNIPKLQNLNTKKNDDCKH